MLWLPVTTIFNLWHLSEVAARLEEQSKIPDVAERVSTALSEDAIYVGEQLRLHDTKETPVWRAGILALNGKPVTLP